MVRLLTIAAMTGFASVCYFLAMSLVKNASGHGLVVRWTVIVFLVFAACVLIAYLAIRPFDVVIGFVIGGLLTPVVHRATKKRGGLRLT